MQCLGDLRCAHRLFAAEPDHLLGELAHAGFARVVPDRVAVAPEHEFQFVQHDRFFVCFHLIDLASDFISCRKQPLTHGRLTRARPRGNFRSGQPVQIKQDHRLAVSLCQERDTAKDRRQALCIAVVARRFIGQTGKNVLGVAAVEQRRFTGAADTEISVDVTRHAPNKGIRLGQSAARVRSLDQREDNIRAKFLRAQAVMRPRIAEAIQLLQQRVVKQFRQVLFLRLLSVI